MVPVREACVDFIFLVAIAISGNTHYVDCDAGDKKPPPNKAPSQRVPVRALVSLYTAPRSLVQATHAVHVDYSRDNKTRVSWINQGEGGVEGSWGGDTQSYGPHASTRVSVQTARAAETIQHMHYCDATKTGKDRSRRSDAALLRALAILASIFDGYCRSQGRGGRRNMGLWGGGSGTQPRSNTTTTTTTKSKRRHTLRQGTLPRAALHTTECRHHATLAAVRRLLRVNAFVAQTEPCCNVSVFNVQDDERTTDVFGASGRFVVAPPRRRINSSRSVTHESNVPVGPTK